MNLIVTIIFLVAVVCPKGRYLPWSHFLYVSSPRVGSPRVITNRLLFIFILAAIFSFLLGYNFPWFVLFNIVPRLGFMISLLFCTAPVSFLLAERVIAGARVSTNTGGPLGMFSDFSKTFCPCAFTLKDREQDTSRCILKFCPILHNPVLHNLPQLLTIFNNII